VASGTSRSESLLDDGIGVIRFGRSFEAARRNNGMALLTLTAHNFDQTVASAGIVMVDCWATWCGACKDFGPVYEKAAARHVEHTFGKLDTQAEKNVVSKLGIEHIPSLLLYRDGILLFQQPGYFDEEQMEDILRQAESIDMEVVRSEMSREGDSKGNAE
jgi:thioredoxin